VLLLNTTDGLLMVDTQLEKESKEIFNYIKTSHKKRVKYLVNTHFHPDHTGGNPLVGKETQIIMHPKAVALYKEMFADVKPQAPFLSGATLWKEGMTVKMGDETVHLYHFGPGHTAGDLVVVFEKAKVLHMGDLFLDDWALSIPLEHGADTGNWIRTIETICKKFPDYKIVPGHGNVTDTAHLSKVAVYLKFLRKEVAAAIKAGKTREEAVNTIDGSAYDHLQAPRQFHKVGLTVKGNIGTVYDEMTGK
ncbi:MAG: MBL fold metallo-hydrolase, partial [bacterium]|nr:MBL fold metallo-hydrolase [bacterium]